MKIFRYLTPAAILVAVAVLTVHATLTIENTGPGLALSLIHI